MNDKLFLRNPEKSVLGKNIVKQGLTLINKLGFEDFTFKKLAVDVKTTEASIYHYFENKHKLLVSLLHGIGVSLSIKLFLAPLILQIPNLNLKLLSN